MPFSVLLSIYTKENPKYFNDCLKSLLEQSYLPNEIVIVKDGVITNELNEILEKFVLIYQNVKVVPLLTNHGLGFALNEGLKHCQYELVARMDTDDLAKPNRFERQVKFMENNPEIAVVGAWVEEFQDTPKNIISVRSLPETSQKLVLYAKKRNPLNHPVVMFRKSEVMKAGGYQHFPLFEDYYLWARMIMNGAKLYNIQECLLSFRSSPEMYKRRGGFKYAIAEVKFLRVLKSIGFITNSECIINIATRFLIRIMPNQLRRYIYQILLRKH